MTRSTLSDFAWKARYRGKRAFLSASRRLGVWAAVIAIGYLAVFWWQHSGVGARFVRWTHTLHLPSHAAHFAAAPDNGYLKAFDHGYQMLRADRRARLVRYEFPAVALRYQQAAASGWRLQSRRTVLAGIAVPRAFRGLLDDQGILFIDPRTTPEAALANPGTPLPLAALQRDFLLVPDLSGSRRTAYQIVPARQTARVELSSMK